MERSEQCSMCSMRVQEQMQVNLQVQAQCVLYTAQSVECSVLPAKDKDLEYIFLGRVQTIGFQKLGIRKTRII